MRRRTPKKQTITTRVRVVVIAHGVRSLTLHHDAKGLFVPGNNASPRGRAYGSERRKRAYLALQRALLKINPRPLDDIEAAQLKLHVCLADRCDRARVGDRNAERCGSTAARLLRELKIERQRTKPERKLTRADTAKVAAILNGGAAR